MKRNTLLFMAIVLFLFSCTSEKKQKVVTVSILPQKYLVERIADKYVTVNVMVPPGMNPATCDLNIRQLKELYNSDICFCMGNLPFETVHLLPVLEKQPQILQIKHASSIHLLHGSCEHASHNHEHGIEPHIWMSPMNAKIIAKQIFDALVAIYPEKEETFTSNYNKLVHDIDLLHEKATKALAEKRNRAFLIYHPALTYLANDYGLEQISIEQYGKEPGPKYLQEIIDSAKEKDIHIIFIQSQFESSNAETIAKAINGRIFPIDPLTNNWVSEMDDIINILNDNLN